MKNINLFKTLFLASFSLLTLTFIACESDALGESTTPIPEELSSELDLWLDETYRVPYNIDVQYRWDSGQLDGEDQSKQIVPPQEHLVQPFMKAVYKIWLRPYTLTAKNKEEFMKNNTCRVLRLVGSGNWNAGGSVTLGKAANGFKITLYTVNSFDLTKGVSRETITEFFRTMHHEFGHILNQRKIYDPNYRNITGGYTADWTSINDVAARELGFVSAYSRSADTEDFVEILSYYTCYTETEWSNLLGTIKSAESKEKIEQKVQSVSTYMRDIYGVDIKLLRTNVTDAITEVLNGNLD